MSEAIPNCAIVLHYYEGSNRFAYHCTNCSQGWRVQPDGSIHPPSAGRVVQIHLDSIPNGQARLAGFQVSLTDSFSGPDWVDPSEFPALGIQSLTVPGGYPPGGDGTTPGPLTVDFGDQTRRLFYRLAVAVGGADDGSQLVLHWDEPKIYDNGSI